MKQSIKTLWTNELRSGNYIQGTMFLEHSGLTCANGILCFVALSEGGCSSYDTANNIGKFDNQMFKLPSSVLKWADLKESSATQISVMNDRGKSFKEIADYIDQNWKTM